MAPGHGLQQESTKNDPYYFVSSFKEREDTEQRNRKDLGGKICKMMKDDESKKKTAHTMDVAKIGVLHSRTIQKVHTLTCCTHIFLVYIQCAYTSHILMRFTHMHGSRVSAVRMSSSLCHLTFSLLMFHPSLLLLFLDGHFETNPDLDDLTDVSVHDFLPNFPDLTAHSAQR